MSFKETLIHGVKKLGRSIGAKSPTLLVVGGTIGLVAAGIVACKETASQLNTVLDEHKQKVQALKDIRDGVVVLDEISTEEYAETKYKKHLTSVYLQTICKLAKTYAPALILALLSVVSILTGHKIITKRHLAAVAECYAVQNTLTEYRKRVAGKLGDEAEKLLFLDGENAIITDTEVDKETGEVKESSHEGIVGPNKKMAYTYICSPATMCSYGMAGSDANFRNMIAIKTQVANEYFERHGHLVLGDIMRHFWNDEYLKDHSEIFSHGYMRDNPLVTEQLPDVAPITTDVKLISGPGEPRKYAVTFHNVQGDIVNALRASKLKERKAKKLSRKINAKIKN